MRRRLVAVAEALVALALPVVASALLIVGRQGTPLPSGIPAILPRAALVLIVLVLGLVERRISAVSRSKEAGSGHGV